MNLTRCSHGHFYDVEKYDQCPHCAISGLRPGGVGLSSRRLGLGEGPARLPGLTGRPGHTGEAVTAPQDPNQQATVSMGESLAEQVQGASPGGFGVGGARDEKTVGFFAAPGGQEPVAGWLVCVAGANYGRDFRLKPGRNFIGRSPSMDVAITGDNTVSRERQAVVIYEPRNQKFHVQAGDARGLCYLNDEIVLAPRELRRYDVLTVGATKLMFFPCCDARFHWEGDAPAGAAPFPSAAPGLGQGLAPPPPPGAGPRAPAAPAPAAPAPAADLGFPDPEPEGLAWDEGEGGDGAAGGEDDGGGDDGGGADGGGWQG
jgi:hypothetical protein